MRIEPRGGPAYAQVADHLRARITSGEVRPGDRLDTEADMTEVYDVSRSTVREALRVLASEHLVETTRGVTGGTFVTVPDVGDVSTVVAANLGQLAMAEQIDLDELLLARELLEVPAARLAAQRRTNEDLAGLRECLVDPRTLSRNARFDTNRGFHGAVVAATGSQVLDLLTRPIATVLRRRYLQDRAPLAFWTSVDQDHRAIAAAIAEGDADGAGVAMHAHLTNLRSAYEAFDGDDG